MRRLKPKPIVIKVRLEGRIIGAIHKIPEGWQYRPKGTSKKLWGEIFPSYETCIASVMSED